MQVTANHIQIEVEDTHPGDTQRPAVMLIMGLGMQLIAWPDALVQSLVAAGYRVIRHDNRDIGLSAHQDHLGRPNLPWNLLKARLGWRVYAPYTLGDMAQDAVGVLDALGVERAHVVGASMGGMIAQRLALHAPARVVSLTSIMSSSGARGLPSASPEVIKALLTKPASSREEDVIATAQALFKVIGSPGFPTPPDELRARIQRAMRRSYHPQGVPRQLMAIAADSHRADLLPRLRLPTLVVHGRADALVPFACGEDTARRIPGARLESVDGMGHDLATGVLERITPPIVAHLRQGDAQP